MKISQNKKFILNTMFTAIMILGISTIPAIIFAVRYAEWKEIFVFSLMFLFCTFPGLYGNKKLSSSVFHVERRVSYFATLVTWITFILIGALPFIYGSDLSVIDAIFESCSAWTTTGASTIDSSLLSASLKIWAGTCSWIGGIGIIVITLMFLPNSGKIGRTMTNSELPSLIFVRSDMTFRKFFKRLIGIYTALTLLQFVALMIAGLAPYTALLTSLNVTSTSGLQCFDHSTILAWSTPIKIIITIVTFLSSLNIGVMLLLLRGKLKEISEMSEFRTYVARIVVTTILIAGIIYTSSGGNIFSILGNTIMQVISFFSTSGYIISDCSKWTGACIALILVQSMIGACAGSTGSGIKNIRLTMLVKSARFGVFRYLHPNSIKNMTIGKNNIDNRTVLSSNVFVTLFITIFLLGTLLLSVVDMSLSESISTSIAMLTNTSVSVGNIAAYGIYAGYSWWTKLVMCFLMLCGRLEIYPVIVIFFKEFWVKDVNN